MPYWLGALLVLTHVAMFVTGALAYHGVRMLSIRPILPGAAKPQLSDAKLLQMAEQIAKRQVQPGPFQHFERFNDMPIKSEYVPTGDGRSREDTFAPAMPVKK